MTTARVEETTATAAVLRAVQANPAAEATRFLPEGEGTGTVLTYEQLHARASRLAAVLQARGAQGERVVLASNDNIEMTVGFVACLYSGAVAVPVPIPEMVKSGPALLRFQAIVKNAEARFFLTDAWPDDSQPTARPWAEALAALSWLRTDDTSRVSSDWQMPPIEPTSAALLQYTSGSTGAPKGIIITQANLLTNQQQIERLWQHDEGRVFVSWLPQFHDMGLIFMTLQSLYLGASMVSMPPAAFVREPLRWLRCLTRYRGSVSAAPNFAFDLCVQKSTPAQREELDLRSVEALSCGAEPVRAATMRRFLAAFTPCGLRPTALAPGYGLAEATVFVTGWPRAGVRTLVLDDRQLGQGRVVPCDAADASSTELVCCGRTVPGMDLAIVSARTQQPCAPDEVGEIWVRGPNVSPGNFNCADGSRENFGHLLADREPYLRTGDLGFVQDGHLYITGRLKDLVIVRGVNHYPQDIENSVERAHPAVRAGFCAAFALEIDGEERLGIAAEINDNYASQDLDTVLEAVIQSVTSRHEVLPYRVALLPRGCIPKTSSGKIQRQLCKQLLLDQQLPLLADLVSTAGESLIPTDLTVAAQTPKYHAMEQYIVELLHLDSEALRSDKNLAAFGFDSIDGADLAKKIKTDWNIEVSLELIPFLTVRELVDTLAQ